MQPKIDAQGEPGIFERSVQSSTPRDPDASTDCIEKGFRFRAQSSTEAERKGNPERTQGTLKTRFIRKEGSICSR